MKERNIIEYGENIYHYIDKINKEKQLIQNNKDITSRNKELILEFCSYRKLKKNNSNARVYKLLNKLKLIALILKKDFDKVNSKDIDKFLEHINNKNDSKATKTDYLIIFKLFYKWLLGNDKEYPELVKDITVIQEKKKRLPSEILEEKDIIAMLNSASNLRDKTIISLLADSGCRISELINLKIKNLVFDNDLIKLIIETGKTGGRSLILIPSVPYISTYINSLPAEIKNNKDNFLFLKMHKSKYLNEQIEYSSIGKLLKNIALLSGINKSVNPHAFRRYSATTSSAFMTDTQLMIRYGWKDRETIDSYTFMNPNQADEAYKQRYGKKEIEIKESELNPIKCSCGTLNPPNSLCSNCGKPNTLKIAIQREEHQQDSLLKLKQVIEILGKNLDYQSKEEIKTILNK